MAINIVIDTADDKKNGTPVSVDQVSMVKENITLLPSKPVIVKVGNTVAVNTSGVSIPRE
jgi:hypothetical protein